MLRSLISCFALLGFLSQAEASDLLAPAKEAVEGRSLMDLSIEWWQWAMMERQERADNPKHCAETSAKSIWFVAGFTKHGQNKIICTVPEGKYLVLRVLTVLSTQSNKLPCTARASVDREEFDKVKVEIDGVKVTNLADYGVSTSNCFNPYRDIAGKKQASSGIIANSGGYWLLLKPPPKGRHLFKVDDGDGDAEEFEVTIE